MKKPEYKRLRFGDYFTICSNNWHKIPTKLELAKYTKVPYVYKKHRFIAEYQVRFDEKRNCIQAIFQQTKEKSDWRVNLSFAKKVYDQFTFDGEVIQIKVHGGWATMWLVMQDKVRAELKELLDRHPDAYIEVFGWSLGSAIATLAAEDIYFKFGIKPHLFTYGSVKPIFGKKTHNYFLKCCEEVYNFYDHCDIVGYMVPFLGWRTINHKKVKLERFCIFKLFNPLKYHTYYHIEKLYKDIEE